MTMKFLYLKYMHLSLESGELWVNISATNHAHGRLEVVRRTLLFKSLDRRKYTYLLL